MDRLGVLGPKGSFSDDAAKKAGKFELVYYNSHDDIFDALKKGNVKCAIVAAENQLSGTIVENLDNIYRNDMHIISEIIIPVHQSLCALSSDEKIKALYSHEQGFSQCRRFLEQYKDAKRIITESTAHAFELIKANNMKGCACIGPKIAAQTYGLEIIKEDIEDFKQNQTRFFLISNESIIPDDADKTSIVFKVKHSPGSLISCLQRLAKHDVNMTKLESRPIPETPWEYLFYVDMEGSVNDDNVKLALSEMEAASYFVRVLGSYHKGKSEN